MGGDFYAQKTKAIPRGEGEPRSAMLAEKLCCGASRKQAQFV